MIAELKRISTKGKSHEKWPEHRKTFSGVFAAEEEAEGENGQSS